MTTGVKWQFFLLNVKGRIWGEETTAVCSGRQEERLASWWPYGTWTKHILDRVHLIPLCVKDTSGSKAKKILFIIVFRPVVISPSTHCSSYDKISIWQLILAFFAHKGGLTGNLYNHALYANRSHHCHCQPHEAAIHYLVVDRMTSTN